MVFQARIRCAALTDAACRALCLAMALAGLFPQEACAKQLAYIHGDIAADGTMPSSPAAPFHQMLLTDSGSRGCSEFKAMVETEGYAISQHYDQAITLDAAFLDRFDAVVFGLHQKVWLAEERAALDSWLRAGGGMLMYSDSAAGGSYQRVGIKNATGQTAVNSLLAPYGMQVTVDQGGGVRAYTSATDACHPIVWDQPEFEGEGVSPIAVSEQSGAQVLIPFEEPFMVSGGGMSIDARGVTIRSRRWAAVAHRQVGAGNIVAIFDRQPMWNSGEGSSIQKRDNRKILRRVVKFLVRDYANGAEWFNVSAAVRPKLADGKSYLEFSFRQWRGGVGNVGIDYTAQRSIFKVEYTPNLQLSSWVSGADILEEVGSAVNNGDGTETVTVRLLPTWPESPMGFVRLKVSCLEAGSAN